jgi:hypothetical protein
MQFLTLTIQTTVVIQAQYPVLIQIFKEPNRNIDMQFLTLTIQTTFGIQSQIAKQHSPMVCHQLGPTLAYPGVPIYCWRTGSDVPG